MRSESIKRTDRFETFVNSKKFQSGEEVSDLIGKNIDILLGHEEEKRLLRHPFQKFADGISAISGSMWFVIFHIFFFAFWLLANAHMLGVRPFDPFPYGLLTTIVSLEAIFLSIFVLIAQNRLQYESDRRAELDVQINLLTEYEVTRILRLVDRIAEKLGVEECDDPELAQLEAEVDPKTVITEIEAKREGQA